MGHLRLSEKNSVGITSDIRKLQSEISKIKRNSLTTIENSDNQFLENDFSKNFFILKVEMQRGEKCREIRDFLHFKSSLTAKTVIKRLRNVTKNGHKKFVKNLICDLAVTAGHLFYVRIKAENNVLHKKCTYF